MGSNVNKIELTPAAISHVQQALHRRGRGIGIRIGVRTTGCSGLAYVLEFTDQILDTDNVFDIDNFKVVVDIKSLPYLNGMTVDHQRRGLNEGFEFINANEKDRCGCGESFRV
jgi:iron-sulfur cluster assembly protein